jgi:hypothetical protein
MESSQLFYVSIQHELFYQIGEKNAIDSCKEVFLDSKTIKTGFHCRMAVTLL